MVGEAPGHGVGIVCAADAQRQRITRPDKAGHLPGLHIGCVIYPFENLEQNEERIRGDVDARPLLVRYGVVDEEGLEVKLLGDHAHFSIRGVGNGDPHEIALVPDRCAQVLQSCLQ